MNENQDYTVFGGWLLVWYWSLLIGGILMLIMMVLPALLTIATSFLIGFIYALGILVSIASACISALFDIQAALQLKARNPKFFDTLVMGSLISFGGGIVSDILKIRRFSGIFRVLSSTVGSAVGVAISLCICIMYFSKSVRVQTYFEGRPLEESQYWTWIQMLPSSIIGG